MARYQQFLPAKRTIRVVATGKFTGEEPHSRILTTRSDPRFRPDDRVCGRGGGRRKTQLSRRAFPFAKADDFHYKSGNKCSTIPAAL